MWRVSGLLANALDSKGKLPWKKGFEGLNPAEKHLVNPAKKRLRGGPRP